jgi:hypothetical protein
MIKKSDEALFVLRLGLAGCDNPQSARAKNIVDYIDEFTMRVLRKLDALAASTSRAA